MTGTFLSRSARVAVVAGVTLAMSMPALASAQGKSTENVPGKECESGQHVGNPHCQVPEVPFAVIYPAIGLASFGLIELYRRRRLEQGA